MQNELVIIIEFIVVLAVINILYIRYRISKPFNYLLKQMKDREIVDEKKLYNNFEFIKVSRLYDELIKLQKEIENKNKQLKMDNKEFILSSIHQLKTPLSVILMNVELLEMKINDESLKEFINEIKASIDTLNLNSQELVYLSLMDDFEYKPTQVNISEIVKERVVFFKQIALSNKKQIELDIENGCIVEINATEFERLVDNNISNAIKYGEQKTTIEISLKKLQNDKLELSFTSYGKEIQNPSKLFEKGYRESKNKDGYGLGLHIIKTICDKYDIDINIQSKEKQTEFKYTFK